MRVTAAQTYAPIYQPQRAGAQQGAKATLPTTSPIEETLNELPSSLTAFMLIRPIDVSLVVTFRLTPVGSKLLPSAYNWETLTT